MTASRIAVIAGDGVGKEVMPEGIRVVDAASRAFGFDVRWDYLDWGCDYYAQHGRMMPEDGLKRIASHDAIFLGAVGWPSVPDAESLWGLLMPLRIGFEQYINLRPVRRFEGVPSPLANPGAIDFLIVRENNEGEYSRIGGRMFSGSQRRDGRSGHSNDPSRMRSSNEVRLRTCTQPIEAKGHLRHEVKRPHPHDAILG